ncbi:hypothetical protein HOP50_09g54460 [Chloropicon primus]|nr:hypothetical protein HOP50_09g54460 [Chloropicon primus]
MDPTSNTSTSTGCSFRLVPKRKRKRNDALSCLRRCGLIVGVVVALALVLVLRVGADDGQDSSSSSSSSSSSCNTRRYSDQARVPRQLCVTRFASEGLHRPRGLLSSPRTGGDVLVADIGPGTGFFTTGGEGGRVIALRDRDGSGKIEEGEWVVLARKSGLNHGLAVHGGYLFASTSDEVWRWPYSPGEWRDLGEGELVLTGMDQTGPPGPGGPLSSPLGHNTRTIIFDESGRLYVSVGSVANVDGDSYRSRIRRFQNLTEPNLAAGVVDFADGEVFADGLRNEVGLAWGDERQEVLYGVENGMDNLARSDLGGDIHEDNPAEELNAFPVSSPGRYYGYPRCFTEFKLDHERAEGKGAQWGLSESDDPYCKSEENVVRPIHSMQAHSAPLGLAFYGQDWKQVSDCCVRKNASACEEISEGLPCEYHGDLFVGFHGSWNRKEPTGHKVVRLVVSRDEGGRVVSVEEEEDFVWADPGPEWSTGFRPVDIAFGKQGALFVSSYKSGEILVVHSPSP